MECGIEYLDEEHMNQTGYKFYGDPPPGWYVNLGQGEWVFDPDESYKWDSADQCFMMHDDIYGPFETEQEAIEYARD